jgi:hypothetical protein
MLASCELVTAQTTLPSSGRDVVGAAPLAQPAAAALIWLLALLSCMPIITTLCHIHG